jgi:hypothetical protein
MKRIHITHVDTDSIYFAISGNPDMGTEQLFDYVIKDKIFHDKHINKFLPNKDLQMYKKDWMNFSQQDKYKIIADEKKLLGLTFEKTYTKLIALGPKCYSGVDKKETYKAKGASLKKNLIRLKDYEHTLDELTVTTGVHTGLQLKGDNMVQLKMEKNVLTCAHTKMHIFENHKCAPLVNDVNYDITDYNCISDLVAEFNYNNYKPIMKQQIYDIKYIDWGVIKKEVNTKSITHDNILYYDFNSDMFYEVFRDQTDLRPYFDFDFTEITDKQLNLIYHLLDKLKPKWGNYSIIGYTNDEKFVNVKKNIVFKPDSNKFLSMRVYFYECKWDRNDMYRLKNEYDKLNTKIFPYDKNPYTKIGLQQVYRIPLSAKLEIKDDTNYINHHKKVNCNNDDVNKYIAQIDGNEKYTARFYDLDFIMKRDKNIKYYSKSKVNQQVNKNNESNINIEEIIKSIAERQGRSDVTKTELFIDYSEWLKLNVALYNCPEDIEYIKQLVIKHKMFRRSDKNRLTSENESGNFTTHNFTRLKAKHNTYASLITWLKNNKFTIVV